MVKYKSILFVILMLTYALVMLTLTKSCQSVKGSAEILEHYVNSGKIPKEVYEYASLYQQKHPKTEFKLSEKERSCIVYIIRENKEIPLLYAQFNKSKNKIIIFYDDKYTNNYIVLNMSNLNTTKVTIKTYTGFKTYSLNVSSSDLDVVLGILKDYY